jgi:hypothetical protein
MMIFSKHVFDDTIGNSGTWYTSADLNAVLGQADELGISAFVTDASGTADLVVDVQHSGDGEHWMGTPGSPIISAVPASNTIHAATVSAGLPLVRLKIGFSAGSTQCRLKLSVTGRVF